MTATTDEAALLRAVLCDPFADAPRLVYADRLEETAGLVPCGACGGAGWSNEMGPNTFPRRCHRCSGSGRVPDGRAARAEFIRVQCELAASPGCSCGGSISPCRACTLRRRERELLSPPRHHDEWCKPCPRKDGFGITFRRGFVEQLTCALAEWCGGPCGRCGGDRLIRSEADIWGEEMARCPDCKGSGERPALGPLIVAAQPVVGVTLTDRRPHRLIGTGIWRWAAAPEFPAKLLNDANNAGNIDLGHHTEALGHRTEADALAAMSRACVDWARAEVELPKLTWPDAEGVTR